MTLIVAFGNPVYDDIITPVIATGDRVLSGCSTNGCLALTRLGYQTALVGTIGCDYYRQFLEDMQRYGVSTHVQQSTQTGGFQLVYDIQGNRTLTLLGCADRITDVPEVCAEAAAIIIGPILQETPLELIQHIYQISRAPLYLDPQGLLRRLGADNQVEHYENPHMAVIAPLCAVIKANEVETQVITGIDPRCDASAAVKALHTLGCRIAIVTLAEAGSIIDDGERQYVIPAYATDARDPTGAGDTYMAGFLSAYLCDPDNLYAAGCTGSATASIWIEHTGPDAPIHPDEVARRTQVLLHQRDM